MRESQETFRRFDELFRQGLISEEDHRQAALSRESAELGFAVARTTVQQGQANLAAMRDALSKSVLRAPFAGRVTGLKAEKGETAIPGTSNLPGAVLMVISDMSELMAEIKANESEVRASAAGPARPGHGRVLPRPGLPGQGLRGGLGGGAHRPGRQSVPGQGLPRHDRRRRGQAAAGHERPCGRPHQRGEGRPEGAAPGGPRAGGLPGGRPEEGPPQPREPLRGLRARERPRPPSARSRPASPTPSTTR